MKVRGELTIERGAGGAVAIQPRRCAAGEPLGFKGARLEGTEGRGLAISVREAELRIEGAGPVALILTPANCPGLAIHVDELRDEDGNLIDVDGFVRLGCDHQSFGRVGGRLEFANCH